MEWLDGEDLSWRLVRGTLSLADSITLLRGVAEALARAHELGVMSRFARVDPSADARGEYVRAASALTTGLSGMGEKEWLGLDVRA